MTAPTHQEAAMPQFFAALTDLATFMRGLLPVGTIVGPRHDTGRIVGRSYTAYEMADGGWRSFDQVHGKPAPATPLVMFR